MAITKQGYESDDSIEEQIRSAAEERSAMKAAPIIEDEAPVNIPMRQTSSSKKAPIITKEQLGGMSLRDYLNKQQGLTRRGDSGTSTTSSKKESSEYRNEGKNKPIPSNDLNMPVNERIKKSLASAREGSGPTDSRSVNQRIKESLEEEKNKPTASSLKDNKIDLRSPATALRSLMSSREPTDNRSVNERIKESLGMKKGGTVKKMASGGSVNSASKRGDGIAQRGKTKGRMC